MSWWRRWYFMTRICRGFNAALFLWNMFTLSRVIARGDFGWRMYYFAALALVAGYGIVLTTVLLRRNRHRVEHPTNL